MNIFQRENFWKEKEVIKKKPPEPKILNICDNQIRRT